MRKCHHPRYASYVKWLEAGGARVVPIEADLDHHKARTLLSQLNGVLFTGGSASLNLSSSVYFEQVANILQYLLQFSDSRPGQAIPLWATCLGHEAVTVYIADDQSILQGGYEAEDVPLSLEFTSNGPSSRMFNASFVDEAYAQSVYDKLATEALTMNFHSFGVAPSVWRSNANVMGNMSLIASSQDVDARWFGALQESRNVEGGYQHVYTSQFHPEKPQFIFDTMNGTNHIVHSLDAVFANQYFVEFFVNECRLSNDNAMDAETYQSSVIYNYAPHWFEQGQSHGPEQVYYFADPN